MSTNNITCNHCGRRFDEENSYCPACRTPAPAQQERDLAATRKKFIYLFIGLAVLCAIMILWLPREI